MTNGERMKNLAALTPLIAERLSARPSAHWIREFEAAGVPVGPVNRIGDMLADPQVAAREMVVEVDHARAGRDEDARPPDQVLARRPGKVTRAAPTFGQHTREVLAGAGLLAPPISTGWWPKARSPADTPLRAFLHKARRGAMPRAPETMRQ